MEIPVFKGEYHGLAVSGEYEPERADVHVVVTLEGVPVLDVRVTASDVEHLVTPILNTLAPLARELGDDFAAWFKKVSADLRPAAAEVVAVGSLRIPARMIGRLLRPNQSRVMTGPAKKVIPAAAAGHGPADSRKMMFDNPPTAATGNASSPIGIDRDAAHAAELAAVQKKYDDLQAAGKALADKAVADAKAAQPETTPGIVPAPLAPNDISTGKDGT